MDAGPDAEPEDVEAEVEGERIRSVRGRELAPGAGANARDEDEKVRRALVSDERRVGRDMLGCGMMRGTDEGEMKGGEGCCDRDAKANFWRAYYMEFEARGER